MSPAELAPLIIASGLLTIMSLIFLVMIVMLLAFINSTVDLFFDINIANEIKRFFNE